MAAMATPSFSMLSTRDPQPSTPYNIEKVLDTINNLVRVLELTLTLSINPTTPAPAPTPATVILPNVTMLRSELDQVSSQSTSDLHSKVLIDHITSISKWATSMSHLPTNSSPSNHLDSSSPPTLSLLPPKVNQQTLKCAFTPTPTPLPTPKGQSLALTHFSYPHDPTQGHTPYSQPLPTSL